MSEPPDTVNFHGSCVCESGAKYKYYGKCVFVPGGESRWEVHLYHQDKVFKNNGFMDSPDMLDKLSGPLTGAPANISGQRDKDGLRELAEMLAKMDIEAWDKSNGRANRPAL